MQPPSLQFEHPTLQEVVSVRPTPSAAAGTLWGAIWEHAQANPTATAIVTTRDEAVAYGDLWAAMAGVAARLNQLGVGRGDVVALLVPQSATALIVSLGALCTAAIAPLSPIANPDDLRRALGQLQPAVVVVFSNDPSPARSAVEGLGLPVILVERPADAPPAQFELRPTGAMRLTTAAPGFALPTDAAALRPTSGTTGLPQWTPWTQARLAMLSRQQAAVYRLSPADRTYNLHSLSTLGINQSLHVLTSGGSIFLSDVYNGTGFFEGLERYKPTWYFTTPSLQQSILDEATRLGITQVERPLRFVRSGGSPGTDRLAERLSTLFQAPVLESYQMTESLVITSTPFPPAAPPPGSVGQSVAYRIQILDPEGMPLPAGEAGEITLMAPEGPAPAWFDAAVGWGLPTGGLGTGDLGYLDADGYLFITGRLKEVIKRGGAQVLPQEIEEVLLTHPDVLEAAAFGVPDPLLIEGVAAAVVLRQGATTDERGLRTWLLARMAPYKVPARVLLAAEIPHNAGGKVVRRTLAGHFARELAARPISGGAPASDLEGRLLALWRDTLRQPDIGVDDDYFELGGNSLQAAVLITRVSKLAGRTINLETLWQASTVRRMADYLATEVVSAYPPAIVPVRPFGDEPPLFCIEPYESRIAFFPLAPRLSPALPVYGVEPQRPHVGPGETITLKGFAAQAKDALRAVQPEGPYRLLGYSWGGMVAFEIAQQLAQEGQAVSFLGLLDTRISVGRKRTWPERIQDFLREMQGKRWAERRHLVLQRWVRLQRHEFEAPVTRIANQGYRPQPYPGRIVLYQAIHRPPQEHTLPAEQWRALARDGVEVVHLSGTHETLLSDTVAGPLVAASIAQHLALPAL